METKGRDNNVVTWFWKEVDNLWDMALMATVNDDHEMADKISKEIFRLINHSIKQPTLF
jgi:hypothetical protein